MSSFSLLLLLLLLLLLQEGRAGAAAAERDSLLQQQKELLEEVRQLEERVKAQGVRRPQVYRHLRRHIYPQTLWWGILFSGV